MPSPRLLMASNRLPLCVEREDRDGESRWRVAPGTGGLATALDSVLTRRGGGWIGWPGTRGDSAAGAAAAAEYCRIFSRKAGYALCPQELREAEAVGYYQRFSNELLWPLFHGFPLTCAPALEDWETYRAVNAAFARRVLEQIQHGDVVWIHDYQLLLAGKELRDRGFDGKIGFFLHIPFAPVDDFLRFPWARELLEGMLVSSLLGFQTPADLERWMECARRLCPDWRPDRGPRLGVFPIGVDFQGFAAAAALPENQAKARSIRDAHDAPFLALSVDRLDYIKGSLERLQALELVFARSPELRGRLGFLQILVPNREWLAQNLVLKQEIERWAARVNEQYGRPGWTPARTIYANLTREELIAYYLAADMALVTPLRDGMNLVAKEYPACRFSEDGILCLSEHAGAAQELRRYALLVDPKDLDGYAATIAQGLCLPREERRWRMRGLREHTRAHDVFAWVDSFLAALLA